MTEMRVPGPLHYLVVSFITQFALAVTALAILLPAGFGGRLPWDTIGFLFAYNIAIATAIAMLLTNHSLGNKAAVTRADGLLLGHLVGILLGGFLGLQLGGAVGALAGAVLLFLVFGWIGSRISLKVGAYLDRGAAPAPRRDSQLALRLARPSNSTLFIYGAIVPGFLMALAVFLRGSGLPFAQYPAILPTARNILVILSLISILVPWVRRTRIIRGRSRSLSSGSALWLIGLGLSLAPAFYGFLLFVAFDMSLAELSLFVAVASMAATAWGASRAG
jgi:hypothetical protein